MPGLIYHPDTSLGTREVLEIKVAGAIIYTFQPGVAQFVMPEHVAYVREAMAAAATVLSIPSAPDCTVTPTGGAAGSQSYQVIPYNDQGDAKPFTAKNTGAGPTTIDATHYNTITWTDVTNTGVKGYKVIRTVGGTSQGLIASLGTGVQTFRDDNSEGPATAYTATVANTSGTSTAVSASTMTDSGQTWTVNQWVGYTVITGGVSMIITSNTASILSGFVGANPTNSNAWLTGATPSTGTYVINPDTFGAASVVVEM